MSTILIIDDNDAVRTALDVLLSLQGHKVIAAGGAQEGLRALASHDVDLVLQDMNFRKEATSGEEGVALFRAIRERHSSLPIVLLTAWTHLETAVELVKAGAADYLAKPWDDARLLTTVRNLLELRQLAAESERAARRRAESRAALAARFDLCGLVFESDAMRDLVTKATHIAPAEVPVLITGPNGSGKEIIAAETLPEREPDRAEIESALSRARGVIARAARELGLSRQALYRRMEKLGLKE